MKKIFITWAPLFGGMFVFLISIYCWQLLLLEAYKLGTPEQLGTWVYLYILFSFARFCWRVAYKIQDNFWYKWHFDKTGDDFEHRFCPCSCGKL